MHLTIHSISQQSKLPLAVIYNCNLYTDVPALVWKKCVLESITSNHFSVDYIYKEQELLTGMYNMKQRPPQVILLNIHMSILKIKNLRPKKFLA